MVLVQPIVAGFAKGLAQTELNSKKNYAQERGHRVRKWQTEKNALKLISLFVYTCRTEDRCPVQT